MNEIIVFPINITFENWVQRLISTFPTEGIPLPPDVSSWWEWAQYLKQNPKFIHSPNPDKDLYPHEESWIDWANYFIQTFNS